MPIMSKEDSNAQDAEQAKLNTKYYAAAAAAGVGEKRRRGQRASPPPALPSSGCELEKLVVELGAIRLRELRVADARHAQQQQQTRSYSRSNNGRLILARHNNCASSDHLAVREGFQILHSVGTAGAAAPDTCTAGRSSSGYGLEGEDDDSGLGAPPPMPPNLKRARACSYSPKRRRKFQDDEDDHFFLG